MRDQTNIEPIRSAEDPIVSTRPHLEKFFERVAPMSGRLIFAIDATASREPTWDMAAGLTAQMFETVAAIGGLDIQLVYYKGYRECVASRWLSDAPSLIAAMKRVRCESGHTQIARVLDHVRKENAREKVAALVLISDACEEDAGDLSRHATELVVPCFLFQDGTSQQVSRTYEEIARITGGAHCKFDAGAAQRLADLLKAVAAFATGGVKALADQNTAAARLLLTQMKK
jgi:hypothetical protein